MKELLMEAYKATKKVSGIDPSKPGNLKAILLDDNSWETYRDSLAEGLDNKKDKEIFKMLCENTRVSLLENSMFQINPYESLTMPILRVFYPKFIAKEAVTVSPMDKPESVKAFIKATFTPSNSVTAYNAPVLTPDISGGPGIGTSVTATLSVPLQDHNIIVDDIHLTLGQAHLERDFEITGVSDGTSWTDVSVVPAVEGHFSSTVPVGLVGGHGAGNDVISGYIDYLAGTISISAAASKVTEIRYKVTCSLEENQVNPKVTMTVEKIRLYAKDRQIQSNWTINMEQDMRALFDVSMQAEIVNLLGQQIALDIDREIVQALVVANSRLNGTSHQGSFLRTPPDTYTWGTKYWHENIIPVLNKLSAQVYTDTNIDAANTILANPLDVAILEDLNGFAYTGTSTNNGDVGYRTATVAGGKWKILTSAVVTQGNMTLIYNPSDEIRAIYFYAPYVPSILHPYPLGYTPSLTILSRYATALVRSGGIAGLTIGA